MADELVDMPAGPSPIADLGHSRLDLDRRSRTGMPEVVFAAGKTPSQCHEIVVRMLADTDDPVIVTRCDPEHHDALSVLDPHGTWSSTLTWRHSPAKVGTIAVVSGGTSDEPVVHECVGTLTAMGAEVRVIRDVGVAGLHRLLGVLDEFDDVDVVVTVAGMEAALPTVLAGLIPVPIVSVPTSVGYGTMFEGLTALLSMLSSCAPGISVVGIDNGFGAACAALRIVGAGR
jgi:NCAIR mutase (PurE)-related protein